ncbi:MAG: sn-glycerol-3-phosphate ABC transporter ATP-binding protein UgpC [Acholeplasmatales bacterium]|jgi:multiple sugar transport system ATP-binding protein|nr:sn-glycerol-3-phosphate ABC transporter ATP-binding protein UgpC [Acholeplasmatales bacterium]
MPNLLLKGVNKIYPNGVQAVYDFNLDIKDGEFVVLVGPSGCGKSTTLRMIAGLEEISSGEMILDDKKINDKAPKDRDIAFVFQNYALYAHLTVYHNMAFSLMLRKVNSNEIHKKVMWAAGVLGLTPYLNRKPGQLSGGQRQRVAVGRAIVRDPKIFLLDEPLSNLDAKLRNSMRKEIRYLHDRLKATFVYVTHDQIEALTLADRIVIMKDGYVQQIGTPIEVYKNPSNLFVANFIGLPPMNTFNGAIDESGNLILNKELVINVFNHPSFEKLKAYRGKEIYVGVRPENIIVSNDHIDSINCFISACETFELLGKNSLVHFNIGREDVIANSPIVNPVKIGETIHYSFEVEHIYFFDKDTEETL